MARLIRYCVKNETHEGENVFLIYRPHIFSNPFTHIKDKKTKAKYVVANRDEAIDFYNDYFDVMIDMSPKFKEEWDKLYDAYKKYDKIYIGCYCNNNERCHGDIIIDKLKKRGIKELVSRFKEDTHK